MVRKETIHPFHLFVLVYMIQSGVTLFSLPRMVGEAYGMNGWLVLFIHYGIASFNIYLIYLVYKKGEGNSPFQLLEKALPKWLYAPFYCFLVIMWGIIAITIVRQYIYILQIFSFPSTSSNWFIVLMLLLVFVFVIQGFYRISLITTLLFYFSFWLLLIGIPIFSAWDIQNMTKFFLVGATDSTVRSTLEVYTGFLGYELVLLWFPYLAKERKNFKAIWLGHSFTFFVYLYACIVAFGFYSFTQLLDNLFPTLIAFQHIELPFLSRFDSLIYAGFLAKVMVTVSLYFWASVHMAKRLMPASNTVWILLAILIVSYVGSLRLDNIRKTVEVLGIASIFDIATAFLLPVLFLIFIAIQKRNKNRR
ncbi:GerAB/ArcD/ProY family transporter [Pontibacillus salicampi]|uniref:GerAB/ArcD/ProY family transporter n=1 Tax=Pontibacillus salicampi TaxID=1449801 RepID=A0ABV6LLB5_9BACI